MTLFSLPPSVTMKIDETRTTNEQQRKLFIGVILMVTVMSLGVLVLLQPLQPQQASLRRSLHNTGTEKKTYTYMNADFVEQRNHLQKSIKLHVDNHNQEYFHMLHVQQQRWYETSHNYTSQDLLAFMQETSSKFKNTLQTNKMQIFLNQDTWEKKRGIDSEYTYNKTQCIHKICGNVQFRQHPITTTTTEKSAPATADDVMVLSELQKYVQQPPSSPASSSASSSKVNDRKVKIAVFSVWIIDDQSKQNASSSSPQHAHGPHRNNNHNTGQQHVMAEGNSQYTTHFYEGDRNTSQLNHQQYCKYHGYDYIHLTLTSQEYLQLMITSEEANILAEKFHIPYGWASVFLAHHLLSDTSSYDYIVKLDMDCLFANMNIRLEEFLDPQERYSIYTSHTLVQSRFTQSHMYILRNDDVAKKFVTQWWGLRYQGFCNNIAQEQGAFHLVLGKTIHNELLLNNQQKNVKEFTCDQFCYAKHRSAFHHHHCVLDWYDDHQLGFSADNTIPRFDLAGIYVYPKFSDDHFISPMEGMTLEVQRSSLSLAADMKMYQKKSTLKVPQDLLWTLGNSEDSTNGVQSMANVNVFQPFTIHPCKKNPYISPHQLMQVIYTC